MSEFATAEQATQYIREHDIAAKSYSRMSKVTLIQILRSKREFLPGFGPERWSKDEVLNALLDERFPDLRAAYEFRTAATDSEISEAAA
jgi:hypothetical protein